MIARYLLNFRSEAGSQKEYNYRRRRTSVRNSQSSSQDVSTQTESNKMTSKIDRTFFIPDRNLGTTDTIGIIQGDIKQLEVKDDLQQPDSYQVGKLNLS